MRLKVYEPLGTFGRRVESELQRQRCKVCWNADGFNFNVPEEIWEAVVPEILRNRVVCLACFDRFAAEKGVEYAKHIHTIYFAGDQATFKFSNARERGVF